MSPLLVKITLVLLFMSIIIPQKSVAEYEQWCIADEQTPDEELKVALDWACGEGGADCSKIQVIILANTSLFPDSEANQFMSFLFCRLLLFRKYKHSHLNVRILIYFPLNIYFWIFIVGDLLSN
ncbi:hypothetical protein ES332_D07G199200v1 [Gossypium tomentosum]|uniref:X8 domain-containing protein n=1 Tax=Gossypium tomentosum TaxID=34277 RepID=A0A5D2K9A2_GOSTO|nr:hypothetical protein ES332_D07G199200v1 [Gossypium tomentosum]